ncbi:hypothetical protein Tco_0969394 [Tanacetum coccineum]
MSNTNNKSDSMGSKDKVSSGSISKYQEIQRLQEKARLSKGGCMKVVMENICSGKENSNSQTVFSKSVKESSLDFKTKDVHVLSKEDLKGTRIEHGFKRAFMSLFGQDDDTFTNTMFLNVDQLQKQLEKDEFFEDGSMAAFCNVTKFVAERTRHKRLYDRRVNKRQIQTQESKVDTGKALDAGLVVIESSGTESEVQDTSSRQQNTEQPEISNEGQHGQFFKAKSNESKIKHDIDEIETINIELEHSVAKLLTENERLHKENEHLKQTYKELYDSIKKTRVQTKDHNDSLIVQLNNKSIENADLKAQIQEKVFAIAALKNKLRKLKGNSEWLRFNNHDFGLDRRKEFKKIFMEIQRKDIERPKSLDIEEFAALHEGIALQNLNQFCHVSFRQGDRTFTSQAWNRLFRIQEQVIKEYVMEFLSSFTFRDSIVDLDNVDTMVFQLGGEKRSMMMRHFTVALGLYTDEEIGNTLFEPFYDMDEGVSIDVLWHIAKFFTDKAKGYKTKNPIVGPHLIGRIARSFGLMTPGALRGVTLGPETSLPSVAKLVELGICKYNAIGYGEIVDDVPEVAIDEGAGAGIGQADVGGVRHHPNMTTTNKLRVMNERLGDIETDISRLVGDVDELTYVERFLTWNTDHLSQLLAHHHIDHTRYNGTPCAYVLDIPNLVVQQGVNFMSRTPIYSTAPSSSPSPFGLFVDDNACPSTSRSQQDDMNED